MQISRNIRYQVYLVLLDILLWATAIFVLMAWRLVADKIIITRYFISYSFFTLIWVLSGLLFEKYKPWRGTPAWRTTLKLLFTLLFTIVGCLLFFYFVYPDLSLSYLLMGGGLVALQNLVVIAFYYSYRYATYMDEELPNYEDRSEQSVLNSPTFLDEEAYRSLRESVIEVSGREVLDFLEENIPLRSSNTLLFETCNLLNIKVVQNYKFDCIVNLSNLNDIVGINRFLGLVNEKLPDKGLFVCSFISQEVYQQQILERYPFAINRIVYWWSIFINRVVPKLLFFRRFYYKIRDGKSRFVSKMEILGRLYYCGFEVENETVIGQRTFIIARRITIPQRDLHRRYGLIIRLPRIGKNGKKIDVYKFRTMYPYAEFVQQYVFEKNSLSQGGKIKNDPRITSYGRFFRRIWIDELPMFINLMKGEMKLIGVRPLSKHYFGLYTKELQEKRTKFKPGLLPPFYADMPKTLDEIQASEMKYLLKCEKNGVFVTDFKYFWNILFNIVFRKARSN